jgi:hypothetical protein
MPLFDLVATVLCRRGLSLPLEIRGFAKAMGTNLKDAISKVGYLKQRMKLAPAAIMLLVDHHNRNLYKDGDVRTMKGFFVVADDGSDVCIPTTPENARTYGVYGKEKNRHKQAMLSIACLFDVLNKAILDVTISPLDTAERPRMLAHMERLPNIIGGNARTIILLDRGYPSLSLFFRFTKAGQKFVVRLKHNTFAKERRSRDGDDIDIWVEFTQSRLYQHRDEPEYPAMAEAGGVPLRIVNVRLGDGSVETVATNLSREEFDASEVGGLYNMRWGVETAFDVLKNNLQMENFTGTKPTLIEQNIYACVYLCNLAHDLIADAEGANAREGRPRGKHPMAVSRAFTIGVLKDELLGVLIEKDPDAAQKKLFAIADEIRRQCLPIRPGRHYPHDKSNSRCKYSNTHKRSF